MSEIAKIRKWFNGIIEKMDYDMLIAIVGLVESLPSGKAVPMMDSKREWLKKVYANIPDDELKEVVENLCKTIGIKSITELTKAKEI